MPFAVNGGTQIYYEVAGSGEPILLFHGLTGSGVRWRDTGYVKGLEHHYQVILIDARGHGQSDKPHQQSAYARVTQAGDVLAVLDALGITATHFWGHSMGGSVAMALALRAPGRVRSLVITGYTPFAAEGAEATEMAHWASDLTGGIAGFVTGYEARHGALPEDVRQRWLENDGEALAACVANLIAESDGALVQALPQISAPTLLLVGSEEPFVDLARETAARLPHGQFVALPGLDHVQTFLRSDLVLPEVERFLTAPA